MPASGASSNRTQRLAIPIEPVWALVKQYIRSLAPRTAVTLRHVARAARDAVLGEHHCPHFFARAGYATSSA